MVICNNDYAPTVTMINFNHWLCYMMWPYHAADVSLSVHLWQTIISHSPFQCGHRCLCMLHQPQRLARQHAYPATVDTALAMIHLDVYMFALRTSLYFLLLIILIIAKLTRLGRRPSYDIIISFFTIRDIKLHYWQQAMR